MQSFTSMHSIRRLSLPCMVAISTAILLSGCAEDQTDVPEQPVEKVDALQHAPMPAIYIDQTAYITGADKMRDHYRMIVDACKKTDAVTVELSESDVDRINTIRFQRWFGDNVTAYRIETFRYVHGRLEDGQHCHFRASSLGRHVVIDQSGMRGISLDTNEPFERVPLTEGDARWITRPVATDGNRTGGVMSAAAGEPCWEFQNIFGFDGATTCTWAEGEQWGFQTSSPGLLSVNMATEHDLFRVVVLAQDGAGRLPDTIETKAFKVGGQLDGAALTPLPATNWPGLKKVP